MTERNRRGPSELLSGKQWRFVCSHVSDKITGYGARCN